MGITAQCLPFLFFCLHVVLFAILIQHCSVAETTDCLVENSVNHPSITDGTSTNKLASLVSPGGIFELGFFTPDGSTEKQRYLGIWYYQSNPKLIVWVANRNKPLLESSGSLVLRNGNAELLDAKGEAYWSMWLPTVVTVSLESRNCQGFERCARGNRANFNNTLRNRANFNNTLGNRANFTNTLGNRANFTNKVCLKDNGNFVSTKQGSPKDTLLWQSFDYPTDTFLPGMDIGQGQLNLTSAEASNNPAQGNYTFMLQIQENNQNKLFINKGSLHYWESKVTTLDPPPQILFDLLLNNLSNWENYNTTRLVINSTGQVQFWNASEGRWSLIWSEPKDRCSLYSICGNFASCNSNNGVLCKCLPGFKPSVQWEAGDMSGGCKPISESPNNNNDSKNDTFVHLPMMAVGTETCTSEITENCTAECLSDPNCVAYSYGSDCSVAGSGTIADKREKRCLIWRYVLGDLQDDFPNGISLYVRIRSSDIEPIPGGCYPCGAYIIPYPLSTGRNCGDPSYFNFQCDSRIGQLNFSTSSGNFKVTSTDPINRNFSIQVIPANSCDSTFINNNVLSDKYSSSFTFRNCNIFRNIPLLEVEHPFIEVEIGWQPPSGPPCKVTSDCNPWPHTTCKTSHGNQMRCICESKFRWDGVKMKCTRVPFTLKVVVSCIAGAMVILIACCLLFVYRKRKRRKIEKQGSSEFSKDDTEGIDVPYFDWEIILAATNNFAAANKLGVGGFGSVYRGKLSDGQEIAVKRLSSVSVQGAEEFRTEVKLIAKLQHRNLVRLVGYCMKPSEKILVYEYMPNGSLDSCLYDEKHYVELDWKKRDDIILGIARGLLYLHQDSRLRIIHRDLKPSNILLDEELNPKISDFGIAKIVGGKETEASTGRIVGTYGYMSPEYASDGIFSVKSDVFSFGVVVLETISGKRNSRIFMIEYGLSLLGHAWKLWNDGRGMELMDPKLNESCFPSEVLKCIHIGLLCVQEDPSDRPTMSTVVHMLSGENASLPPAKQPAFMNRKPLSDTASSSSTKDMKDMITISTVGR